MLPPAVPAPGDSPSSDLFAALLRGDDDGSGGTAVPGAPLVTPPAAFFPTENHVDEPPSAPGQADATAEPSASRRERRRRRFFGRA